MGKHGQKLRQERQADELEKAGNIDSRSFVTSTVRAMLTRRRAIVERIEKWGKDPVYIDQLKQIDKFLEIVKIDKNGKRVQK